MPTAWSLDRARHTYSIPYWSDGYFDVDAGGRMVALPRGAGGPALALPEVLEQATRAGLKLPLLLRFSDILGDRLAKLQAAFGNAMKELEYTGGYTSVYPIKVNQHFGVAGELVAQGGEGFGLEAGSKPELMAVLGMALIWLTLVTWRLARTWRDQPAKTRRFMRLAFWKQGQHSGSAARAALRAAR